MERTYEKISPTAKFVAYFRTFSDIPFSAEIASACGAEEAFRELAGENRESLVRFSPYWEARYKTTDRILAREGITQVLEVAAGLSPRGLAMTEDPHAIHVGTDLPGMLEESRQIAEAILAKRNLQRPNLHHAVANALDQEGLSQVAAWFRPSERIAIITEGLFPYFSRTEQETLAQNVRAILATHPGLWIATDVHTRGYFEAALRLDQDGQERHKRIATSTGSNFARNLFADEDDRRLFFEQAGFRMEEHPYSAILQELSSLERLAPNPSHREAALARIAHSSAFVLTPTKA